MRTVGLTAVVAWASLGASDAAAQQQRFLYPTPPPAAVRVTTSIPFARIDSTTLAMDVYRPAGRSAASPAIIVVRPFFDPGRPPERQASEWMKGWARVAAANGVVAILPDLRGRTYAEELRLLVAHLSERANQYGIDRERLAVFAASAPVSIALPAVEDPAQTAIKAAVMYYGSATVTTFRRDLPVLFVRAGLDHPELNAPIERLASLAVAQNAPVTLLNHHTGRHNFEMLDDDIATRQVIEQTLDFVKRATEPAYQALLRGRNLDAVAAGYLSTGDYREAVRTMGELLKQRPADGLLRFHYAGALMGDGQFAAACAEYRSFTPPNYAAILPGSHSCVLAGAVDTTIVWLQRMPKGWLQANDFRADSVFAPLWERSDFQALFRP